MAIRNFTMAAKAALIAELDAIISCYTDAYNNYDSIYQSISNEMQVGIYDRASWLASVASSKNWAAAQISVAAVNKVIVETVWASVYGIDAGMQVEMEWYAKEVRVIENSIKEITALFTADNALTVFGQAPSLFAAKCDKIDNTLESELRETVLEAAMDVADIPEEQRAELMEKLSTLEDNFGYSPAELASLVRTVESDTDLKVLNLLLDGDYEAVFAHDADEVSEAFSFSLYCYSYKIDEAYRTTTDKETQAWLTAELERYINAIVDYSEVCAAGTALPWEISALQDHRDDWLSLMAANAQAHVFQTSMAMATMEGEGIGGAAFDAMARTNNNAMELSALWAGLFFLTTPDGSGNYAPHAEQGFNITNIVRGAQGFSFTVNDYMTPQGNTSHGYTASFGPELGSRNIVANGLPGTAEMRDASTIAAFEELERKAQALYISSFITVLGVVCSVHPVAATIYGALAAAYALSQRETADAVKESGGVVKGLAEGDQRVSTAGTLVKGLADVIKLYSSLDSLSKEEQAIVDKYWQGLSGWGMSVEVDGSTYVIPAEEMTYEGLLGLALLSGGGVGALYESRCNDDFWQQAMIDTVEDLKQPGSAWSGEALTPEREYLLYGSDSGHKLEELDFEALLEAQGELESYCAEKDATKSCPAISKVISGDVA